MSREEIGQFFVRFKGAIMGVVLLALCASGIAFFLDSRSEKQRIKDGDAIYDVLRRNDGSVKQRLAEVSDTSKGIVARLAKFKLAAGHVRSGSVVSAKELYYDLAADTGLTRELRELAEYFAIVLSLDGEDIDEALEERLVRLASGKDSIYRSSAKEALIVSKLRKNDVDAAVLVMKEVLGDPALNMEIRRNVEGLLRVYGHK
ncbi:hypothetical protein ANAPC1_00642 [Anaplasma phagocytophilum]|uniref:Tetratricopeptide repeat-like domain-containing protein n=2 Tax=Anaplasma phagocytophilum TaxID=948 RepID=A0A098EGP9_ANAPH|nr:hypothetical protein [Anaplasma phagocytophilum]CEG20476.1 Uncharacterized protein ANAPHAGO_00535 [Anaplasma phagocytophilum]SBO14295.1 hypothetical protein ANAPC1_00642 [Anaplasma phagocytophilum]SBO30455.1 hypothetical protein ANAPC4_00204 [Anaplasma phagocytophilum]SBO30462.1 hypothetical protein ANAPC3_00211 [Anaplasma phagocytophilum]SBO31622.1 hypothetical protein ANAPC2_00728 [Anaplasma phagocytophilum]